MKRIIDINLLFKEKCLSLVFSDGKKKHFAFSELQKRAANSALIVGFNWLSDDVIELCFFDDTRFKFSPIDKS